jgi:hypothetical protein
MREARSNITPLKGAIEMAIGKIRMYVTPTYDNKKWDPTNRTMIGINKGTILEIRGEAFNKIKAAFMNPTFIAGIYNVEYKTWTKTARGYGYEEKLFFGAFSLKPKNEILALLEKEIGLKLTKQEETFYLKAIGILFGAFNGLNGRNEGSSSEKDEAKVNSKEYPEDAVKRYLNEELHVSGKFYSATMTKKQTIELFFREFSE